MLVLEFLAWAAGIVGIPVIGFYWLRGLRRRVELRHAAEPSASSLPRTAVASGTAEPGARHADVAPEVSPDSERHRLKPDPPA